jgi:gliding motility-associated-like protein
MVTFNRATEQLEAYWLGSALGADSLDFFTKNVNNDKVKIDSTVIIDQNAPLRSHAFTTSILDGTSVAQLVGARAKDKCDNEVDAPIAYHQSMDVEAEWKVCDSINLVTWTKYVGLNPNFAVEYQVFYSEDGGVNWMAAPNSIGIDNNYEHFIAKGGKTYHYYVQAKSLDPNVPSWVLPNSNVDSVYSVYEDSPQYGYVTYATVLPQNLVELNYYRDTSAPVKSYTIFRGEIPTELAPIAVINANTLANQDRMSYIDNTADVNAREYYYRVAAQNECGNVTNTSNFGRTIHLAVESDDEAMKNTLRWNRYLKWDSTVAYYNIYRTSTVFYTTEVYKKILPEDTYDYHVFVDDLSDAVNSKGTFFYRVEAVQGAVLPSAVNGAANNLTPQFAPNGINKTFGPKGQFFDYTQFEMTIYNRWGELIYQSRNINQGWDGTVDGKDASLGSYVYMIRYKDGKGKERRRRGTVTLIR